MASAAPADAPPAGGGSAPAGPKLEPSERVLRLWRGAQAVCFDVDCTVAVNDQLDLLAEFMGVGDAVAQVRGVHSTHRGGCWWAL